MLDANTIPETVGPTLAAAFATWETATQKCGAIAFKLRRAPTDTADHTTVHLRTDRWCAPSSVCFVSGAASVTRVTFVDIPGDPSDGAILGADIELNAVDFELLLPGATPVTTKPALDLQSVATHEVGHLLGLAHDCGTGLEPWPVDQLGRAVPPCNTPGVAASTMYYMLKPNDIEARSLEDNDIAGACSLTRTLVCEGVVSGGCATGGGSSGWLLGIAVPLVCWRRKCQPRAVRVTTSPNATRCKP